MSDSRLADQRELMHSLARKVAAAHDHFVLHFRRKSLNDVELGIGEHELLCEGIGELSRVIDELEELAGHKTPSSWGDWFSIRTCRHDDKPDEKPEDPFFELHVAEAHPLPQNHRWNKLGRMKA